MTNASDGPAGIWRLHSKAGQPLGAIEVQDIDVPWLRGRWNPEPAFDTVQPLFERELQALDHIDHDSDAWETAHQQILDAVTLTAPHERRPVASFILHINGDEAWWRWTDEPLHD